MSAVLLPAKISIIIPVYNVEGYIARCLDSCIDQTLFDIEIVCVDDGSTDRSLQILDYYAQKDKRVKVIHKENGGVAAARNTGIDNSTGSWLMFVDSDDYLDKAACEKIWTEIAEGGAEIIVHGGTIVPDYPKPEAWKYWTVITRKAYFPSFVYRTITERGATPFLWLQVFSRELLNRSGVRFHEGISLGEDLIFQYEIFPDAHGVRFMEDKLYYYRWYRSGSLMYQYADKNDNKILRHILNIGIIAESWNKKGIMEVYGKKFLDWALAFVVPDLCNLELKDKKNLAVKLDEVLDNADLYKYKSGISLKGRSFYRKMKQIQRGE